MHILCIDDYQDIRDLLAFALRNDGHQVTVGCSVREGRQLIDGQHYDMYIVDGLLGDGYGLDLCRYIRNSGDDSLIVFYSGMSDLADMELAKAAGANICLTKPIHLQTLLRLVAHCHDPALALA